LCAIQEGIGYLPHEACWNQTHQIEQILRSSCSQDILPAAMHYQTVAPGLALSDLPTGTLASMLQAITECKKTLSHA
jgi:hypothetical protein